jgi:hypothetical protein
MKRSLRSSIFVFVMFIILFSSFVSAGFLSNLWVKATGKVVMYDCFDTCYSLGYQCGIQSICGISVNCGTCSTGYTCSSGQCMPLNSTCTSNIQCNDNNSCTKDLCSGGACMSFLISGCSQNQTYTNQTYAITTNACVDGDNGINYYQKEYSSFYSYHTVLLKEGETINVSGRLISLAFINSTFVRLNIDGLIITELIPKYRSYIYNYTWDVITINQINYSQNFSGVNRIEFTLQNLVNSMTNSTD